MTANAEPTASAGSGNAMPNVWCVRADHGKYTDHFVRGSYFGYGAQKWGDFSRCRDKQEIMEKLKEFLPSKKAREVYGGMMARFLFGIQDGDWVITPEKGRRRLRYGQVVPGACPYAEKSQDGCPYPTRRKIDWKDEPLDRWSLPPSFQNTLKCNLTVFSIKHNRDFLAAIRRAQ